MIIVDLNQVMISNLMMQLGNHTNAKIEENLLRHMVLNSLRSYRTKFYGEYKGDFVIACDDRNNWRKEVFPYYKAIRKKNRDESELNWTQIFEYLNKIKLELKEYFPYPVIQIEGAEADDVIGTLAYQYGKVLCTENDERILILSGDKDFVQLQEFANVDQYDPVHKKAIKVKDPVSFTKELIMKGDRGDGIPNFLSSDNCFVIGERQKPITTKKLESWIIQKPEEFCDSNMLRGYKRNEQLIHLSFTPDSIRSAILENYKSQVGKPRDKLFNYFINNKLKNLMEHIREF